MKAVSVALRIVYAGTCIVLMCQRSIVIDSVFRHQNDFLISCFLTHTHTHTRLGTTPSTVSGKTPQEGAVAIINCAVDPKLNSQQAHHYVTGKSIECMPSPTSR